MAFCRAKANGGLDRKQVVMYKEDYVHKKENTYNNQLYFKFSSCNC